MPLNTYVLQNTSVIYRHRRPRMLHLLRQVFRTNTGKLQVTWNHAVYDRHSLETLALPISWKAKLRYKSPALAWQRGGQWTQ